VKRAAPAPPTEDLFGLLGAPLRVIRYLFEVLAEERIEDGFLPVAAATVIFSHE
jgi:hypothetical protein